MLNFVESFLFIPFFFHSTIILGIKIINQDKGKLFEKKGRKVTDLRRETKMAGLPD